jgi:hypothetical protein
LSKAKALPATCLSSVVTAMGFAVTPVTILSEGKGQSSGVLIMDGEQAFYIASNAGDLKTTLEKVASALTEIATTLTAIGAGMTGPTTAPPPTLPTSVTAINAVVTQLNALKEVLK